jgi:hypothetical protein
MSSPVVFGQLRCVGVTAPHAAAEERWLVGAGVPDTAEEQPNASCAPIEEDGWELVPSPPECCSDDFDGDLAGVRLACSSLSKPSVRWLFSRCMLHSTSLVHLHCVSSCADICCLLFLRTTTEVNLDPFGCALSLSLASFRTRKFARAVSAARHVKSAGPCHQPSQPSLCSHNKPCAARSSERNAAVRAAGKRRRDQSRGLFMCASPSLHEFRPLARPHPAFCPGPQELNAIRR